MNTNDLGPESPSLPPPAAGGSVVAFIDMGTNSVRLLVARLLGGAAYQVLTQQKEVIRLGEGEFLDQCLQPAAMDRAVLVCRKFAEMAGSFASAQIVAVATSATREAGNQAEFLSRLRNEAGLNVHVISGREEARLVYLGIASAVHLDGRLAAFIDIGGGSTEIAIGDQDDLQLTESLKLGPIRLATQFFAPSDPSPVSPSLYADLKKHVRHTAVRALQNAAGYRLDLAFGSSGTVENLTEIAARALQGRARAREDCLRYEDLRRVREMLCGLPLSERREVPGINPERADIIVPGAAILETLMEELHLSEIRVVADRGLREGLLIDFLARHPQHGEAMRALSVRERSVWQLARACGVDEPHARRVAGLALEMFDSGRAAGLHRLGDAERELLGYAALLHDVGSFLSYSNHHVHTYYLIRNAELLGFDQTEIAVMAAIGLFHRKGVAGKKRAELVGLDRAARRAVAICSLLVRIAESLDRSHQGVIRHARLEKTGKKQATLLIQAAGDCQLEVWGVENQKAAFARVFGRELNIEGV